MLFTKIETILCQPQWDVKMIKTVSDNDLLLSIWVVIQISYAVDTRRVMKIIFIHI